MTAPRRPSRVKVGIDEWVIEVKKLRKNLEGETLPSKRVIRVSSRLPLSAQRGVMLHELLHAIWHSYGLPPKGGEERIVTALETPLWQTLSRNPSLLRWMFPPTKGST